MTEDTGIKGDATETAEFNAIEGENALITFMEEQLASARLNRHIFTAITPVTAILSIFAAIKYDQFYRMQAISGASQITPEFFLTIGTCLLLALTSAGLVHNQSHVEKLESRLED